MNRELIIQSFIIIFTALEALTLAVLRNNPNEALIQLLKNLEQMRHIWERKRSELF